MQTRFYPIALMLFLGTGLTPIYSTAQPVLVPDYTEVTDERLLNPEAHNWLSYRGTLDGWGFSRLNEIDDSNVQQLEPVWKGPFVEESLMKKVDKYKDDPKKIPIKTWSRKSTILPDFVGVSFQIYNGKKFIPITVSEDMVGHKLGEFAPTRTFFGHTPADKKAKPATAEKK